MSHATGLDLLAGFGQPCRCRRNIAWFRAPWNRRSGGRNSNPGFVAFTGTDARKPLIGLRPCGGGRASWSAARLGAVYGALAVIDTAAAELHRNRRRELHRPYPGERCLPRRVITASLGSR